MTSIRVMVVATDPLARAGLAALLEETGAAVVGRDAGNSVLAAAEAYQPEVVVWDLGADVDVAVDELSELSDLHELELPTLLLLADGCVSLLVGSSARLRNG